MRCEYGVFQVVLLIFLVIFGILGGLIALYTYFQTKHPKHILSLDFEEKQDFINSFDHVISDCDDVLWLVIGPIKNAGIGFALLQEAGKSLNFISNNAMRTDEEYIQKLTSLGIPNLDKDDFIHPDKTIVSYLKHHPKYKKVYVLAGRVFKNALNESGVIVLDEPIFQHELTLESFSESIVPLEPIDAVIIDVSLDLTYVQYCKALLYAKQYPDCDLIVGASDNNLPLVEDIIIPGPQALIDFMEQYSGKKAIMLGKPGAELRTHIRKLYNITKPERYLFIGDNLSADIGFYEFNAISDIVCYVWSQFS